MMTDQQYDQYKAFPFSTDPQFQQGLAEILGKNTDLDPDEAQLRARVFYFNNTTGSSLSVEKVRQLESSSPQTLTFAQLQQLIESGKVDEIPNNKVISGELNVGIDYRRVSSRFNTQQTDPPTQSQAAPRKKPWELAERTNSSQ